jgi:hypothetical protein
VVCWDLCSFQCRYNAKRDRFHVSWCRVDRAATTFFRGNLMETFSKRSLCVVLQYCPDKMDILVSVVRNRL